MSSTVGKRLFLVAVLCFVHLDCEVYQDRPKIKTSDGDLILEPALDRNIYLRPNGPKSSIYIGNVNVLKANSPNEGIAYQPSTNDNVNNNLNSILQRLEKLEAKDSAIPVDLLLNISLLYRKVNNIHRKLLNLQLQINSKAKDECDSNPCEHGGTCLNLVNGYHCLCPSNWEGRDCDVDVNECRNFAGTDLGCQNGATCINRPGTYECLCKSGWFGLHCTRKAKDCSGGDSEMCGHGTCVQVTTGEGIQCLCHQGWTTNGTGVSCLTDINECESYQGPRCSVNPKVDCINLPGSFRCGQCPRGYEGDGYICSDIDECLTIPNGGCSPLVTCHNTIGSRICGSCPADYQGDGVTCSWRGACNIRHGGCHPSAQCIESPSPTGRTIQCICPEGMTGDGVGISGCYVSTSRNWNYTEPCENNPCGSHGQCHSLRTGYTCICFKGYSGAHCDQTSVCAVNPCHNGGICRQDDTAIAGFRCECTAQYSGSLCQVRSKSCGGVLDSEEGSIVYPLTNTTYKHNSQCAWVIHTAPDKVINVTFSKFNLEGNDCLYDFLQIHDGRKSSSQLLGRFCGNSYPMGGNIVSSHNNLYFWFHSDSTVAKDGFALHWTSNKPVCGGEIHTTSHGHISSPGSPGPYPPNRDCYWHITTTLGKRINLHFFALDIESHSNCSFDYLAIYDGEHTSDPLISRYCNSSQPAPVQSAGSDILIHFHSDAYGSGRGFQIAYATIEGVPGCGGYYTADKGELVSPTYDGVYLNNLLCEYKIKTSIDTKIKIDFKSFKLERTFRCVYDYLKIYDGPSPSARLVGQFCGTTYPNSYTSSSNTLYLKFRTDRSMASEGFRIKYEAICEKTLTGDSGVIQSPGYPFSYPANKECVYIITTVPGKAIQLTFQDFDIEDNRYYDCRYDNVEVRDGHDKNATLLGRYCGGAAHTPPVQTSSLNYMYIRFQTDMSVSGTGFYANYTTIDTVCGGIYRETTGLINFPSGVSYENYQSCKWLLIAPEGMHIKLTWNRFDIEDMSDCNSDYLQLTEMDDNNENVVLGKFCGVRSPPAFTTSTNRLKLEFESDGSIRASGFSVSYTFLDEKSHCGGIYIKSHGFIYSPGWPKSYEPNRDCTWVITVPVGQQIKLNISQFNIERPIRNKCNLGDYLEIRNGEGENSPLIGQYCGAFQSKIIVSLSNVIHLHFHSDFYLTGTGFKIEWDGTITGCGGTLTSPAGTITSPNYPNNYNDNAECFYRIVTSAGSKIQITFTELDLERTLQCRDDYVEIYDGRDTDARLLGKHCIMSPELANIETSTNYAFIKFRSDLYQGGKGFMLNYATICTNNITGRYGVIESPGYPSNYPLNLNCLWNIQVPKGNKINVTFTHFDIHKASLFYRSWTRRHHSTSFRYPSTEICALDYLKVKETSDPNYSDALCGSSLPRPITTKSNSLLIQFHSTIYMSGTGFRLEWVSYGCGGHILKQMGTISIDKSKTSQSEMECEWLLETQAGKSFSITFTDIYMTDTHNCTTDAVEIYNGQNMNAPLLTKICHRDYVSLDSDTNYVFVRFVKRSSLRDVNFSLQYRSKNAQCGGSITSRSGLIHSKNYPKNYDNNLNCYWYITVPAYHRIELNFLDIDLYSLTDNNPADELSCGVGDLIQIYDNNSNMPSSNYTYRICPNSNKTQIVSKYNNLIVQFKSDNYGTAKGFKANFAITCGAVIRAEHEGFIRSDSFVNNLNKSCVWTILALTPDQKIYLTLTSLLLPKDNNIITNRNCPSSFLRVLDGDDERAPLIGEYCGRKVPPMMVSRGSALTIEFGSYTGRIAGMFSAHYSTLSNACGGTLDSEEGTIGSPNYPGPYTGNTDCEWFIKASSGNTAYVQFERFDLEFSEDCNEDYVEVRETDGAGRLLGVYCGSEIPTNHTAASQIYIKFHSNSKTNGLGFLLHYGLQRQNYIIGESGEISSPLYPTLYLGSSEYAWRVMTTDSDTIALRIDKLQIYSHNEMNYNTLTIYNGYDVSAPILEEMSGILSDTKVIQSSSSVIYIIFKTDASNAGSIFHMSWSKTSRNQNLQPENSINCGGNYTEIVIPGRIVTINSPNYPNMYDNDLNCEWVFKSQKGRHLTIKFLDFKLEETSSCFADSVSIYSSNTPGNWKLVKENICTSESASNIADISTYLKVNFKTDGSIYKKGFKALIASKCGGLLTDLSGQISLTWLDILSQYRYQPRVQCDWTVKVRPGRTIKLFFSHFNITNKNDDCSAFVMLRNGDSVEAPTLSSGKYCGLEHEKKTDIVTSSNSLFVSYKKSASYPFQTFTINYEEQNDECGATSTLSSNNRLEIIYSPNYPYVPTPYSECEWVFNGPPGEILRIDFIDRFDLDYVNDCETEAVEIRDGSSRLSPLLGRFCGEKPGTIKSRSNAMYIKYITLLAEPRNGFRAKVSIDTCGGTIITNAGEVTSPGYPHMQVLPYGTVCKWHIIGPPRHVFLIKPQDIELPQSETPCSNKVTIEEAMPVNNTVTVLRILCFEEGYDLGAVETSRNNFTINLYIGKPDSYDQISQNRGFRITFNSSRPSCGGVITAPEGYLTSPSYPQETTLRYCQWLIILPDKSRKVRLEMIDLDTEKHRIALYNDISFHSLIQVIPSQDYIPGTTVFESSGSKLALYVWLNRTATSHRFKAKFTSDEQSLCGGDLTGITQELLSPDLNRSYTCEWHYNNQVQTAINSDIDTNNTSLNYNSIMATIKMNSSVSRTHCRYFDPQVAIRGSLKNNIKFTRQICGNTELSYIIPSSVIDVTATKSKHTSLYFHLDLKAQPCGGVVHVGEDPVNILNVPEYFNGTLDCAWILIIPVYNRVEIKMDGYFTLECEDEFLKISRSLREDAEVIQNLCKGKLLERPLVTHFSQMYIQYHSNVKNNTNVRLMARTIKNQCGGYLSSYEYTFASPNYPKQYSSNLECSWEIRAEEGYRVSLQFIGRFDMETKVNCTKDAVIIYDWKDEAFTEIARVCGRVAPPPLNSTYNRMKVVLRTDDGSNHDGFKAKWNRICGGNYYAEDKEQILYSPGYPYNYAPHLSCSYAISASMGKVMLKFLDFELEGPYPDCSSDNLTLTAQSDSNYVYEVYCGSEIPPIATQFSLVSLIFKSDSFIQRKGFRISYSIFKCGGKVNDSTVLSSSLTDTYDENMNCTWLIEAPSNKVVVLKFLYIDIEAHHLCNSDYVAAYEGLDINDDKRLALLCGHLNSTTVVKSKGNTMLLQFVSDSSVSFKGFKVQIYFSFSESAQCGGRINLSATSSRILKSPLMGHPVYENFLDCYWTIISPPDTIIKIEFTSFHVSPCENVNQTALGYSKCDCDLVEVRDGLNPNSLLMGTYCGHSLPPQLISSANLMSLRLYTDGEIQSQGFEATLSVQQTLCGHSLISVSHIPQRIKSPGFDTGSIPRGIHCSYNLDVQTDPFTAVHITVVTLDLRPPDAEGGDINRCNRDKMIISSHRSASNITAGKNFIRNYQMDDFFSRYNFYETTLRYPEQFEYCGQKHVSDLYVYGSTSIRIITSSESDSKIHKGVEIEVAFTGYCGRNYSEPFGRIQSSYPSALDSTASDDCYTLITAPENYTISSYFINAMPDYWDENCYLDIFDGNNTKATRLVKIHTDYDNRPIFSTGRYMLLHNHVNNNNHLAYDLNYVTTNKGPGCGGKSQGEFGRITSPLYPNTYRHKSTCEWELETPVDTRLLLRFSVFDLGNTCDQNYVQLINSKNLVVRTFCSEMPADFTSEDHYVKVVFVTTLNNGGTGWVADFIGTRF